MQQTQQSLRNNPQPQQPQQPQQQKNHKQPQGQQPNQLTWPAPPIYLMKRMDTMLFQQSQSIDEIKNRLNCIETGSLSEMGVSGLDLEQIKPVLIADDEFVSGIVDNIMTNSNLSEIIEQIDAVQTENRELRDLLHAQQKTINEMNIMLLKIFSQSMNQIAPSSSIAKDIPAPAPESAPAAPAPESEQEEQEEEEEEEQEQEEEQEEESEPIQLDGLDSNMQTVD